MMKILLKTLLAFLPIIIVNGQSFTGSASFLKRGMSARAIGLGSAFTAVADDASATFWNPAGLLNSKGFNLQFSDLQDNLMSLGDVNSPQIAFSHNPRKPLFKRIYWAYGVSANGYFVKDIDQYDSDSNYEGSFNYGEYAVFLSTAFKVRFIKLGFTWKFIEQNFGLDDPFIQNNTKSLAQKPHDLGVIFNPVDFLTVGMIVRDSMKVGLYDTYPKSSQLGVKFDLNALKTSLPHIILATDVIVFQQSLNKLNIGLEYELPINDDLSVSIRTGLSNMLFGDVLNDSVNVSLEKINQLNKKISVGLGIQYNKYTLDLAWVQEITQNPFSRFLVFTFSFKP